MLAYLNGPKTVTARDEMPSMPADVAGVTGKSQDGPGTVSLVDIEDEADALRATPQTMKVLTGEVKGRGYDAQSFASRIAGGDLLQYTKNRSSSGDHYERADGRMLMVGDSELGYWQGPSTQAYIQLFSNLRMGDIHGYGDEDALKRIGLTQETAGMTREQVAEAAETLIDELISPSIYEAKAYRVYAYTMSQLEELRRSKTWGRDAGALEEIGVEDGFLFFVELDLCIGEIAVLSERRVVGWTEKSEWEPVTMPAYVMMTVDAILRMDVWLKEPRGQMREENAVAAEEIVKRYALREKNDLYVDPARLDEACLQYMIARYGTGERARYALMPVWCFERTDGRQAFFDAVTGEHIDTLNPGFYG